jgi:hypothetical protein
MNYACIGKPSIRQVIEAEEMTYDMEDIIKLSKGKPQAQACIIDEAL